MGWMLQENALPGDWGTGMHQALPTRQSRGLVESWEVCLEWLTVWDDRALSPSLAPANLSRRGRGVTQWPTLLGTSRKCHNYPQLGQTTSDQGHPSKSARRHCFILPWPHRICAILKSCHRTQAPDLFLLRSSSLLCGEGHILGLENVILLK